MSRHLPDDFLFGCATAAHQVEGGQDNDWTEMEGAHPERIHDGSVSGIACDHYRRFSDDLATLAAMHHNAHRFSIEWSRIEPQEGVFDRRELLHYGEVIASCRRQGMEPMVTLHHFTLPRWLAARGGLRHRDAPRLFARYAAACTQAWGSQVRWWLTINEPAVLAILGYIYGEWPPLRRSMQECFSALRGLARMHAGAYTAVHSVARSHGWSVRVSLAHHERPFRPLRPRSPLDHLATRFPDLLLNRWFLNACNSGRLQWPVGTGEVVPGLRGSLDYLGLNYYCEELVRFQLRAVRHAFAQTTPPLGVPVSAFGWSIDADGLRRALVRLWNQHHLPILVTENGVADMADELRPVFLREHLRAVHDALLAGVDVRGYLHWTSTDNFEWAQGYSKRFGLIAVDRQTLERTPKPSAAVYAEICRTHEVPDG